MALEEEMKANPDSKIIRTGKTRDDVTAFLHEDGTVSHRLSTFGFTALDTNIMHRFFDNIEVVHSADMPRAIKAANRGHLPFIANEELLESESRARLQRIAEKIYNDRRIERIS